MISLRSRWILIACAVFALAWAIARAAVQSITIDEANTYVQFVSRHLYLWYAANNHILNSTLMYGFTRLLGLSQFTARLPALLGAALYISAAYRLCRLLTASLFVQVTVFVCLVFNPFIFDYLVAARGYSLALGFLMWALVFSAESQMQGGSLIVACAVSSACAGMSVSANFSFAFVNLVWRRSCFHCWVSRALRGCSTPRPESRSWDGRPRRSSPSPWPCIGPRFVFSVCSFRRIAQPSISSRFS